MGLNQSTNLARGSMTEELLLVKLSQTTSTNRFRSRPCNRKLPWKCYSLKEITMLARHPLDLNLQSLIPNGQLRTTDNSGQIKSISSQITLENKPSNHLSILCHRLTEDILTGISKMDANMNLFVQTRLQISIECFK